MAGMVVSNVSILMISDLNPIQLKPLWADQNFMEHAVNTCRLKVSSKLIQ
jgi:hypothetical protein